MGESAAVVRHTTGTVSIEGDQVVVRMAGTRNRLFRSPVPWSDDMTLPVRRAWARWEPDNLHAGQRELRLIDGDTPWQAVRGCDPVEVDDFLLDLRAAKRAGRERLAVSAARPAQDGGLRADCERCGAPSQLVGQPCAYCRGTVSPPARSTNASAASDSSSG